MNNQELAYFLDRVERFSRLIYKLNSPLNLFNLMSTDVYFEALEICEETKRIKEKLKGQND